MAGCHSGDAEGTYLEGYVLPNMQEQVVRAMEDIFKEDD
jgi:hypothetical protein